MSRVVRLLLLVAVALVASCGRSAVTSSGAPSAVLSNGAVRLQWNPVTGQNVTGYLVYYGTGSRSYLQPWGQGLDSSASSFTVTGLAGSRRYFFAVTATNAQGRESGFSDEVFLDIP